MHKLTGSIIFLCSVNRTLGLQVCFGFCSSCSYVRRSRRDSFAFAVPCLRLFVSVIDILGGATGSNERFGA